MTHWRVWALALGGAVAVCGAVLYRFTGAPTILILGVLMLLTAAIEPIYGRATGRPIGGHWRATGERFVEPETGRLVTVWFNPKTGQRRYVDEAQAGPPAA